MYLPLKVTENELGKVGKSILENINQRLVKLLYANQWEIFASVLEWFKNIEDKKNFIFIKFDINKA